MQHSKCNMRILFLLCPTAVKNITRKRNTEKKNIEKAAFSNAKVRIVNKFTKR